MSLRVTSIPTIPKWQEFQISEMDTKLEIVNMGPCSIVC
jgi:hypothetical protein